MHQAAVFLILDHDEVLEFTNLQLQVTPCKTVRVLDLCL